jgi:hypothetical protein
MTAQPSGESTNGFGEEDGMDDERRDGQREPTFRQAELVTTGSEGEASFPIILRDAGLAGIGGVYVGQDPFTPEGAAELRDADGGNQMVRVIWTRKLAEYVHIVGLEVATAG